MSKKEKTDLTEGVLLSLLYDVTEMEENMRQTKVKVFALARAYGIVPPTE